MRDRILNIVLVLVLATLPMAANAGWSEAQKKALLTTEAYGASHTGNVDLVTSPSHYGDDQPPKNTIISVDAEGTATTFVAADSSDLAASQPSDCTLPPPTLISPIGGGEVNTLIPIFRWSRAEVTLYRFQLSTLSDFSTLILNVYPTRPPQSDPRMTLNFNLSPNTVFYWRVASACGSGTGYGPFSSPASLRTGNVTGPFVGSPTLISPVDGAQQSSPQVSFSWSDVPDATAWQIRFYGSLSQAQGDDQWHVGGGAYSTTYWSHGIRLTFDPGTHFWRVAAGNSTGWGALSTEAWSFTVGGESTYSIFGVVTAADGTRMDGVTITDNAGHTTSTDFNGDYALANLAEGTYILTPSKNGYTFCPRSRSISVPPNQFGGNFSGSPVGIDLDFCPEPNGFGFANTQLWRTWPMFEQYFGSAAVRNTDGSICTTAQQYFDQTYRGVANGWSSTGFTLASLHSYQSHPQPNAGPFAIAPYSNLYAQPLSSQLTSPIAYYSGVQLSAQYQNEYQGWLATCAADPNQMVARLQQAIQTGNPLLLSLKAGSVYHALTPYRVVTVSPTETHIYVYDSEAPGQQRIVRMQRSGSGWQWQYTFVGSLASAGTRTGGCVDMYYYQASASLAQGAPLVDLCTDTRGATPDSLSAPDGTGKLLSVLPAAGNWYLQDNAGRRLGWAGGQWLSEIPGGYELPQTVSDAAPSQRLLYLPAGAYTVRADAGASRVVDYSLFADGRVLQMDGQTSAAGVTSVIGISPGLEAISLTQPAQFTSLAVEMVRELPTASRVAGLSSSAVTGNAELAITFDGQALEMSRASGTMSYRLRFFQPGASTGYFASAPITLEPDQAHRLTPASWNGLNAGTVLLEIDEGRDGTVDETVTLTNQVRSLYLPIVLSIR